MDHRTCTTSESISNARLVAQRQSHAQLRQRLLNPNVRLTGRDESALRLQIEEKKRREAEEKADDMSYAVFVKSMTSHLREVDIRHENDKKSVREDLKAAWERQISERNRMEAAVDAPVGVSSAQVFDGEDPAKAKRSALQKAQVRKWSRMQQAEKAERELQERVDDRAYAAHVNEVIEHLDRVDADDVRNAALRTKRIQQENLQVAAQRADERAREELESKSEAFPLLDTTMLSESREVGVSSIDANRIRTDHYKGMDAVERRAIREAQALQILEKQAAKRQEREQDKLWVAQQKKILNLADNVSMQQQESLRELNREVTRFNDAIIAQNESKAAEEEPPFSPSFFERFGTSHR